VRAVVRRAAARKHIILQRAYMMDLQPSPQKPMNLFALIDEESFYPSGTDISMLQKLKGIHSSNELFAGRVVFSLIRTFHENSKF